ncbi:MAG TPA: HD domain-containing phosphohydrolase [Syntrophorhabdaceae bacterium]
MEKHDLKAWNEELEMYVQQQTIELTRQNQEYELLYKKMKSGFKDFTITISNLIELRDKSMASHSNDVAMFSHGLARKMGLDDGDTETVAVSAQLHDIGKIGISDSVLFKDVEEMAPYEWEEYKTHPVRGQTALTSNEILRESGFLIRHHHEAFDGRGFPDGLKGDAIPLGSRIIAIADRYDRLLLTRTPGKALEEMRSFSGTHFDPEILSFFRESAREITRADTFKDRAMESEFHPEDLMPEMITSRDVKSGTGLLLISKGIVLNPRKIDSLRRHYRLDPPRTGVYVWVESKSI